jgi:hypothetical protein
MEVNSKMIGAFFGAMVMAAGGGAFTNHATQASTLAAQASTAVNVCDTVVEQFLQQMKDQRDSCNERVRTCWERRQADLDEEEENPTQ